MKQGLILIITLLSLNFVLKSQTPSEDPKHYVLDTYDDFNSFNSNLWNNPPYMTWGLETYSANNVTASGGVLTLKCEKVGNQYISGGIDSKDKRYFSYGYFEVDIKTPASGNKGPWGGWWLFAQAGGWDEIDIFEPTGYDNFLGTQFRSGICATYNGKKNVWGETHSTLHAGYPNLSTNFNKFALIWTPQYAQVLFNGNLVYEVFEWKYVPSHPMCMHFTFQVENWESLPEPFFAPFPLYWQFKNFKYYRLKTDCANGITQTNFNFATHSDYKVQKFYSLTNTTVPNNSNVVIRATDYIEFKGEFTVLLGSKFTATTHCETCPN